MGSLWHRVSGLGGMLLLMAIPALADDVLTADEATRYAELDGRPLHRFRNVDLADYLQLRNKVLTARPDQPSLGEEVGHFARKSLGQTYRLNAVRWDLAESDCVVFTERCIAMACASDWDSYYRISERLRHKDGVVAYRNRNFFTLGDWLPNNQWLFANASDQLGLEGELSGNFTHVVRPKVFEEIPTVSGDVRIVFKGSDYVSGIKQIHTEGYIPRDRVPEVLPRLKVGDIALVLRDAAGGHIGCDHLLILDQESDGRIMAVAGSPPNARSEELVSFLHRYKFVSGFTFVRLRNDAREATRAELERLAHSVTVVSPLEMDQRVDALRASRSAKGEGAR